ncbi:MAG TPA: hypothetical protein VGP15_17970 [Burkholderiales bacterium]|jgi:hypothetical protein|nr:hypothetical protein [Burkholderiales bacterium]
MTILGSLFSTIGTWFGFVGSCVAGADATCRPFLAFVALAIVSGSALVLVVRAYKALQPEAERREAEERRTRLREQQMQQRVRRSLSAKVAPRSTGHRGWRMPA